MNAAFVVDYVQQFDCPLLNKIFQENIYLLYLLLIIMIPMWKLDFLPAQIKITLGVWLKYYYYYCCCCITSILEKSNLAVSMIF